MKLTYYKRDLNPGHRDGAYFEIKQSLIDGDSKDSNTAYWLADHKGERAPEGAYVELEKSFRENASNNQIWIESTKELPDPFATVIIYLGEIEETCVGYYDSDSGIWFISDGCDEFRMGDEPLYLSPFLVSFWMSMPEKPEYTYQSGLRLAADNDE
tara:strand:- start:193 stop:660 length:468 start_codon:yes stop_codon:yes gene_type:complete